MVKLACAALVAAIGFVLALAPAARAQEVKRGTVAPISDVSGSATYRAYCTVCHGVLGKGDGPAAKALTVPPADLTRIAKRTGGKFDAAAVRLSITGETVIASHGTRDMPMWGPVFRSVDDKGATDVRLRNLVVYLQNLQEKP